MSHAARSGHRLTVSGRDMLSQQTAGCIESNFRNLMWRTLMSVDDVISEVVDLARELGIEHNTYFMFSSDRGYSFGELNFEWDKRNVYEFDTKIHMLIKGPRGPPGEPPAGSRDQLRHRADPHGARRGRRRHDPTSHRRQELPAPGDR